MDDSPVVSRVTVSRLTHPREEATLVNREDLLILKVGFRFHHTSGVDTTGAPLVITQIAYQVAHRRWVLIDLGSISIEY